MIQTVEQLIENSTRTLENTAVSNDLVGNRPHYPMMVFMSSDMENEPYRLIHRKLERIWPNTINNIAFYSYMFQQEEMKISNEDKNNILDAKVLQSRMDEIRMARDVFDDMKMWCIYNVVDTQKMKSVEEFEKHYNAITEISNIVLDSMKTMLIVLLDASTSNSENASEIRRFLAGKSMDSSQNMYDGTVIISNMARGGGKYSSKEISRISSNVIILSNNDAVGKFDDEDYKKRITVLYNKNFNTVSYSVLQRPNKNIAMQIMDTVLKRVDSILKENSSSGTVFWKKKIGVNEKNRISFFEKKLQNINVDFDISILSYLPLKSCNVGLENYRINQMTYQELKQISFEDTLQEIVEDYIEAKESEMEIFTWLTEYEKFLRKQMSVRELSKLQDSTIHQIIENLDKGSVNDGLSVNQYMKESIELFLRNKYIYPKVKEILKKLRRDAEKTIENIDIVKKELNRFIPIDGFEDVGTMYKTMAENYLNVGKGEENINKLLRPGNSIENILAEIFQSIKNISLDNSETFSLSFIKEWERRLNMVGETVYKEIKDKMDSNGPEEILLKGTFSVDEKLQIYMLHTCDARGENDTDLYKMLKEAYKGIENAQFFNTGCEDSIEVMKIVDCSGDKLLQ